MQNEVINVVEYTQEEVFRDWDTINYPEGSIPYILTMIIRFPFLLGFIAVFIVGAIIAAVLFAIFIIALVVLGGTYLIIKGVLVDIPYKIYQKITNRNS